jgi:hypothetical protein
MAVLHLSAEDRLLQGFDPLLVPLEFGESILPLLRCGRLTDILSRLDKAPQGVPADVSVSMFHGTIYGLWCNGGERQSAER